MARHDFRFAIDGFELNEDEQALVAAKVQEAGLVALAELGHRQGLGIAVGGGPNNLIFDKLRWRGYWLLHEAYVPEVIGGFEKAGLLDQMQGNVQR